MPIDLKSFGARLRRAVAYLGDSATEPGRAAERVVAGVLGDGAAEREKLRKTCAHLRQEHRRQFAERAREINGPKAVSATWRDATSPGPDGDAPSDLTANAARAFDPDAEAGPYWQGYFRLLMKMRENKKKAPKPRDFDKNLLTEGADASTQWAKHGFDWRDTTPSQAREIGRAKTQTADRLARGLGARSDEFIKAISARREKIKKIERLLEARDAALADTARAAVVAQAADAATEAATSRAAEQTPVDDEGKLQEIANTASVAPLKLSKSEERRFLSIMRRRCREAHAKLETRAKEAKEIAADGIEDQMRDDLYEIVQRSLDTAKAVFEQVYEATYETTKEQESRGETLLDRLRDREAIPEAGLSIRQREKFLWPEAVRGRVVRVMKTDGKVFYRRAVTGEPSPLSPFRYWRIRDAFSIFARGPASALLRGLLRLSDRAFGEARVNRCADALRLARRVRAMRRPERDALRAVGVDFDRGTHLYLDWTLLPHQATQARRDISQSDEDAPRPVVLHFSAAAVDQMKERLTRFAAAFKSCAPLEAPSGVEAAAKWKAERDRTYEEIVELPGVDVIRAWLEGLKETGLPDRASRRDTFGLCAAVDHSGFISICLSAPGLERTHLTWETAASLAICMAHLVKFAVDRDAVGEGGPDANLPGGRVHKKRKEAYGLHTALIAPVRVAWDEAAPDGDLKSLARALLATGTLARLRLRENRTQGEGLYRASTALVELSSRFGRVLDENLPQLRDGDDLGRESADEARKALRERDSYSAISSFFFRSSLALGLALFAFCILPSFEFFKSFIEGFVEPYIDSESWSGLALTEVEIKCLFALFFMLSFLRLFAAYGLGRIVHYERGADRNKLMRMPARLFARVFFANKSIAFLDVVVFTAAAAYCYFQNYTPEIEFLSSTQSHATFGDVLLDTLWALPAIGAGVLMQSVNNLSSTISQLQEETGEIVALRRLAWVRETAERYNAHLTHTFVAGEKGDAAQLDASVIEKLPKFELAEAAIARARARVDRLVESRRRSFVQTSALTVAVVTFLGSVGSINELKPNAPRSDEDFFRRADLLAAINDLGAEETRRAALTGDVRVASLATQTDGSTEADRAQTIRDCRTPPKLDIFKTRLKKRWEDDQKARYEERKAAAQASGETIEVEPPKTLEMDEAAYERRYVAYLSGLYMFCQRELFGAASVSGLASLFGQIGALATPLEGAKTALENIETHTVETAVHTHETAIYAKEAALHTGIGFADMSQLAALLSKAGDDIDMVKWTSILNASFESAGDTTKIAAFVEAARGKTAETLLHELKTLFPNSPSHPRDILSLTVRVDDVVGADPRKTVAEYVTETIAGEDSVLDIGAKISLVDDPSWPPQIEPIVIPAHVVAHYDVFELMMLRENMQAALALLDPLDIDVEPHFKDLEESLRRLQREIDRRRGPHIDVMLSPPKPQEIDDLVRRVRDMIDDHPDKPKIEVGLGLTPPRCDKGSWCGEPAGPGAECKRIASFFFEFGESASDKVLCSEFLGAAAPFRPGFLDGEDLGSAYCSLDRLSRAPTTGEKLKLQDDRLAVRAYIRGLAAEMKGDGRSPAQFVLAGYADSNGARSVNAKIARNRAASLSDWLEVGDLARVSTIGRGEEAVQPDAKEGLLFVNQRSRRADVLLCRPSR